MPAPTITSFALNPSTGNAGVLVRTGSAPNNTIAITGTNFTSGSTVTISVSIHDTITPSSINSSSPYSFTINGPGTQINAAFQDAPSASSPSPLPPSTDVTVTVTTTAGSASLTLNMSTNASDPS